MIDKTNFTFCVGYSGETAIIDGDLKRRYAKLGAVELAESGLFKPAVCSAVYDKDDSLLEQVLAVYNAQAVKKLTTVKEFKSLFGVNAVPEGINKVSVIKY